MNGIYRVDDIDRNIKLAGFYPLDVLVVGGTGGGKSSTINALFKSDVVKVGRTCEPETTTISSVELDERLRFWDSPGLGDSIEKDKKYSKDLIDCLHRYYYMDDNNYGLIDIVLVILDGSGRDMGTVYNLLNEVIVPNFQTERVLVAINQADIAMKGYHWNESLNCPDNVLLQFLEEKADSVQKRITEATGINALKPVYYSAEKGYNIEKLLDMVIDNMPREKRSLVLKTQKVRGVPGVSRGC